MDQTIMTSETNPSDSVVSPAEQHIQESPSPVAGLPTGTSQQGDGRNAPVDQTKKPSEVSQSVPPANVVELAPHGPTFKEQVYGYARLIRGKVLGQPGVKEQGEQVLRGEQGIPLRRGSQSSK